MLLSLLKGFESANMVILMNAFFLLLHRICVCLFTVVSSSFGSEYFQKLLYCCAGFSSRSSALFLPLVVHISSASRLVHSTASLCSEFCAAGRLNLFYSRAITFMSHAAGRITCNASVSNSWSCEVAPLVRQSAFTPSEHVR